MFFGKFGVLCLLETPVLRLALLPYYRRVMGAVLTHFRVIFPILYPLGAVLPTEVIYKIGILTRNWLIVTTISTFV